ncbi:MAG: glycosyltransferase family 2 protein, partial [Sphingobacteriaceae bacterium]
MDDPQPRIAVITVNWNRPSLTTSCYNALKTSIGIDWHLFIVDNGSTDESVQILSKLSSNVSLIETGINSGWAGGNNRGIKIALDQSFEWIFLLNNDAAVNETTLSELWKAAVHAPSSTPVIGAVQFDNEGGDSFFGNKDISNSVFHAGITEAEFDQKPSLYQTSVVKGAALFCHKNHFDSIGMFDERFFLNFEEVDWCVRARNLGFEVLMSKKATVKHCGSGSMGGYKSP